MKNNINPTIIKYKVEYNSGIFRKIFVYNYDDVLIGELECFGTFYTNQEEIQNWLDENGRCDDDYEFVNITE